MEGGHRPGGPKKGGESYILVDCGEKLKNSGYTRDVQSTNLGDVYNCFTVAKNDETYSMIIFPVNANFLDVVINTKLFPRIHESWKCNVENGMGKNVFITDHMKGSFQYLLTKQTETPRTKLLGLLKMFELIHSFHENGYLFAGIHKNKILNKTNYIKRKEVELYYLSFGDLKKIDKTKTDFGKDRIYEEFFTRIIEFYDYVKNLIQPKKLAEAIKKEMEKLTVSEIKDFYMKKREEDPITFEEALENERNFIEYLRDKFYEIERNTDIVPTLFYAIRDQNYRLVIELINEGADVNEKDSFGSPVLYQAIYRSPTDDDRIVNLLIERGADVKVKFSDHDSFLSKCLDKNYIIMFQKLLKHGADIHQKYYQERSILYKAIYSGKNDYVELLLEFGADPNERDDLGKTPLMCMFENPNISEGKIYPIAEMLTEAGADPKLKDRRGEGAYDIAKSRQYHNIIELFDNVDAYAVKQPDYSAKYFSLE